MEKEIAVLGSDKVVVAAYYETGGEMVLRVVAYGHAVKNAYIGQLMYVPLDILSEASLMNERARSS